MDRIKAAIAAREAALMALERARRLTPDEKEKMLADIRRMKRLVEESDG